ncbi:Glyoxylate reductase, partial [Durusdinium trenchii]
RPSGGGQQLWEMRLLATRRHGPFLSWLISDNDRLLEESDFVAVTVPGFVRGLINKTSLALMKPHAVLIPISANPVDFDALYQVLLTRSIGAVLDVWPQGCWHFPDMFCGPPYAEEAQPFWANLATLENVVVLPGVAMRDEIFWSNSAHFVAANLVALVDGRPLRGVVCNASDPWPTV